MHLGVCAYRVVGVSECGCECVWVFSGCGWVVVHGPVQMSWSGCGGVGRWGYVGDCWVAGRRVGVGKEVHAPLPHSTPLDSHENKPSLCLAHYLDVRFTSVPPRTCPRQKNTHKKTKHYS